MLMLLDRYIGGFRYNYSLSCWTQLRWMKLCLNRFALSFPERSNKYKWSPTRENYMLWAIMTCLSLSTMSQLSQCVDEIERWMQNRMFWLSQDKAEMKLAGRRTIIEEMAETMIFYPNEATFLWLWRLWATVWSFWTHLGLQDSNSSQNDIHPSIARQEFEEQSQLSTSLSPPTCLSWYIYGYCQRYLNIEAIRTHLEMTMQVDQKLMLIQLALVLCKAWQSSENLLS